jgi:hypothetical protein
MREQLSRTRFNIVFACLLVLGFIASLTTTSTSTALTVCDTPGL